MKNTLCRLPARASWLLLPAFVLLLPAATDFTAEG
jgi:hypothetical protein